MISLTSIFLIFIGYICVVISYFIIEKVSWLQKDFIRFILVGIVNTLNYYILFLILHSFADYLLAHIIAFIISGSISFFITTIYTFKTKPTLINFIKFPITYLPNLIISTLITSLLVKNQILNENIASLVAMIVSIPVTFIVAKLLLNSKRDEKHEI